MFNVWSPSRETSTALCCCLWCCYVVVVVDDDDDDDVDVALFASLTILHYFPNKLEFDQHFDDKMKDLFNKYVLQSLDQRISLDLTILNLYNCSKCYFKG